MKAVVVYESIWGNTASVARAIAEGLGAGTQALSTSEATRSVLEGADLVVAGAPLMAFSLPTESTRNNLGSYEAKAPRPPDLSSPSMRSWLKTIPQASGRCAAFETRFRWSPGSATKSILRGLERAGRTSADKGQRFIVEGTYGPMREGELERARQWGAELARSLQ